MDVSAKDLYPVVQDLTDAEYGCCSSEMIFGSFSLQELAVPSTTPRSLPSPDRTQLQHDRKSRTQSMQRDNSLLQNGSATEERERADSGEVCGGPSRFEDNFVLTRQIFRCRVSTVWECVHRRTGNRHCVKAVDRRRFTSAQDETAALNEIAMMSFLREYASEKNVVQALQISQDPHRFYIVMNLVEGGNLANFLSQERIGEEQVQSLAKSLLESLAELHSFGIGHFNLQPENVLLGPDFQVSLCDFGNAAFVEEKDSIRRQSNLAYASPEELLKRPGLATDMWSVGVILYYSFCGHLPFDDSSKKKLKAKIFGHSYDFFSIEWALVSRSAKQFLSSLLHPDPQIRMTAKEALSHSWLSSSQPNRSLVKRRRRVRLVEHVWGRLKKQPQKDSNDLRTVSTISSSSSHL